MFGTWHAILVLMFVVCSTAVSSQHHLMVYGMVKDQATGGPIQNARVRIHTATVEGDSVFTDPMGRYQIRLPFQAEHMIEYNNELHHPKWVQMSTVHDMDSLDRQQEWGLRVDINLANSDLELPVDLIEMPAGIAAWISERHAFEWNGPYSERYKLRFKKEVKAAAERK